MRHLVNLLLVVWNFILVYILQPLFDKQVLDSILVLASIILTIIISIKYILDIIDKKKDKIE